MNIWSVRTIMGSVVAALIGTLAWTGTPARSAPLETGRRDINLEPVKVTDDTTIEDLLRGYTDEELAAAEKVVSHAEEPPFPTPIRRDVKVTGIVYLDENENGGRDEGEAGIAGVAVSDGEGIKKTGADGRFSFELIAGEEVHFRFVFATRPTGYKPTTQWFHRIPFAEEKTEYTAAFGFAKDPASAKEEFWFVQVADSQFDEVSQMITIAKDYAQMTSSPGDPAFLITIGDLTAHGTHSEFDKYDRIRGASNIPVYDGFGGHDGLFQQPDVLTTANFAEHIGPPYFTFDYGGVHFIYYVGETYFLFGTTRGRMFRWLDAVLQNIPKGEPVIFASHRPMEYTWFDKKREEGVNLLCQLAGHHHLVLEGSRADVPVIVTGPARGFDQGAHSRAYRWIYVTPGGVTTDLRVAGQYQRLEVPAPGSKALQGRQSLKVLAYDSVLKVKNVTARVTSPTGSVSSPALKQEGDWGWGTGIDLNEAGTWTFSLQAESFTGVKWQREHAIEVGKEHPAKARLGDDFPWLLAGTPVRRLKDGPVPPLYPRWVRHTESIHVLHGTPALANGRLFVPFTNPNVGGATGGILCLDAKTGRELWRAKPPRGDMRGPLTVRDDRVFAVTTESWAAAYDAETGKLLWSRPLDPRYELGAPLAENRSPPVPTPHGLLVCVEEHNHGELKPLLLDYATGETVKVLQMMTWVYYLGFPTVYDDVAYTAARGVTQAMRIPSGEMIWEEKSGVRNSSGMLVVDGKLIYSSDHGVMAHDAATGKKLWTGRGGGGYLLPVPVVWDDLVLINGHILQALDLATGETRFEVKHVTDRARFERSQRQGGVRNLQGLSTPLVAGDLAFYGHDDFSVRAIDRTGKVVWEYNVGSPIKTSPVISGNLLFVHDLAGYLWCFGPVE